MTFPSIVDREISTSGALFLAFSSPIVAFMDTVDVLLDLYVQVVLGVSLQDAAWKTLWRRARERFEKDVKVIEPTYL